MSMPQPATINEPLPIWMAALVASEAGSVRWQWLGRRAVYRNQSARPEVIEPLGVRVDRGETVVVTWLPGDTEYTVQLYGRDSFGD